MNLKMKYWLCSLILSLVLTFGTNSAFGNSAYDLNGTWITEANRGYEILLKATSENTFEAHYTNIKNDNVFKGDINYSKRPTEITVRQFYGDGRLYGTYIMKLNSNHNISGVLVDYTGNRGNINWIKK